MLNSLRTIFLGKSNEIEALNGLRAFAVLGIMIHHYWGGVRLSYISNETVALLSRIPQNMNSVMDMFFMLSGFLISAGLWLDWKKNGTITFGKYFMRRSFRIFPLYYVGFLFHFLIMGAQLKLQSQAQVVDPQSLETLKQCYAHWPWDVFFISNYSTYRVVPHAWSLALEEQFYTVLPLFTYLFLFRLTFTKRMIVMGVLYFLPAIFRSLVLPELKNEFDEQLRISFPTHMRADSLIIGIIIMDFYFNYAGAKDFIKNRVARILGLTLGFGMVIAGHLTLFEENAFLFSVARYNFFNAGFGLIFLFGLSYGTALNKFLSWRGFTPIARVSYGMYMWHGIAGAAGMAVALRGLSLDKLNVLQGFSGFIAGSIFTFVAGVVSFVLLENPFMNLRTRLAGSSPDLKTAEKEASA